MKLAKELSKRGTGRTLYILDEPTTGLHFEDTRKLLDVLNKLVDQGNTIVVIEHNLDVIKSADYVIDLGPEGGAGGGRVIAAGTPEEVARHDQSATGRFLAGPPVARRQPGERTGREWPVDLSVVVGWPQFHGRRCGGVPQTKRSHGRQPTTREISINSLINKGY